MRSHSFGSVVTVLALSILTLSHACGGEILEVRDCRVSAVERVVLAGEKLAIVASIPVHAGQVVKQGDVVVQFRDDAARTLLASAQQEAGNDVDLRYARKLSELSTLEYSKAQQLNQEIPGGHAEMEVLKLRLAAERALLQIEQASHHLELAELRRMEAEAAVESYRIRTPVSGTVLNVHQRPGEAVAAGSPVVEIANFDRMRVEGFLPVADSWRVQPGDPVAIQLSGESLPLGIREMEFPGEVSFVDPQINEVSQQVRIWAEVENPRQILKDGLIAKMRIAIRNETKAIAPVTLKP
ncbi:MAG: HlyD family efflux transporter periplasmic adaptor subunit [Planctomycetaceae bacterium]|nr:HlyD family efflux transporter periplasmic adaptor subunit [Planctomycetaceae bacterium]